MADFNFELVSPERLLLSERVTEVVIPATEGEMTVMANHAPTMTTLKPGVVTVKTAGGKTERYVVFGGFADILPTGCTLLAESAVPADELDRSAIEKRVAAVKSQIDENSHSDEHLTRLEQFLSELTQLNEIVVAA
ncbi:F0F1 ATP synthase subunit epsilon [Pararhizobium capsulatum]|nr:F0F1 ATP synthase subunit epsilon [Pararhizobium capsulatum]